LRGDGMRRLGLLICLLITLVIACALELTRIWVLLVIASIVGGFLSKSFVKAVIAGGLGLLMCWIIYLGAYYVMNPIGVGIAASMFSLILIISLVLVLVLGLLGASFGYFLSRVLERQRGKV